MKFYERNEQFSSNVACICEGGREYTYRQLWDMGDELMAQYAEKGRHLVLLQVSNDIESVAVYLANLRAGNPMILMSRNADSSLVEGMKETYGLTKNAHESGADRGTQRIEMHPDLALLLSTSGSTGARKLVRLSYDNLQSNCDSIVEYLQLTDRERPITTLPMEYTYGLSVIHSHLAVGATIVLTNRTIFDTEFWNMVSGLDITSMAGVPYTYEMYDRLKMTTMDLPALRTMTQAGGHLKPELQEKFASWASQTGRRFFVMYGQTEATARMSYLPPEMCLAKAGSIGIPIPGGRIELAEDGEMIYYGRNVSMGYATSREDLAKGDENRGRLQTGDVAYRDEDGYLFITGRKKRFIKLQGKRISLDQIQDDLQETFETSDIVCTGADDREISIWLCGDFDKKENMAEITEIFAGKWGIRGRMLKFRSIDRIPRNSSGKIIYAELK